MKSRDIPELVCRDRRLGGAKPWIMGILNVTPDSFSDGGRFDAPQAWARRIEEMLEQGADLIDIGGESTRPGSVGVSATEEIRRIRAPIERALELGAVVSVDTRKPQVAEAALELGAHLVNDVGGLQDEMLGVVARHGATGIAMHMQGSPETMQQKPRYADVVGEVADFLDSRLEAARRYEVPIVLDPGIGFGKRLEHNLQLLASLDRLRELGAPLLLGVSRKSFLAKLTSRAVDERLAGSLASALWGLTLGVDMLRVHDVAAHVDAREVWCRLQESREAQDRPTSDGPAPGARIEGTPAVRTEDVAIFVEGLELRVHLGVPAEERAETQVVRCQLQLERRTGSAVAAEAAPALPDDELASTADYVRAIDVARREAERRPRKLLETLSLDLIDALETAFPGWRACVELDKPQIADELGVERVGVVR